MIRLFIFIIIASLIFSLIGYLIYQLKNYKTNVPDNLAFKNDYLDKIEYSLNELKTRFGTSDSEIIKLNEVHKTFLATINGMVKNAKEFNNEEIMLLVRKMENEIIDTRNKLRNEASTKNQNLLNQFEKTTKEIKSDI